MVAISFSFIATMATVLAFGILLVVGSIVEIVSAIFGRCWRGFFLHLLTGILYFIAGVFLIDNPVRGAMGLTLVVALFLLVGGIFRIVESLVEQFEGWGWMLLSGIISLLLGIAIWRRWPLSGLKFIGLFVGIEMMFTGVSWLMLGLALRTVPTPTPPPGPPEPAGP
jgi:uncharacterized membrane protein HdeD (DUF308 family)